MPVLTLFAVLLSAPPADADRQTLQAAGVNPDDPAAAVGYLRKRTLGPDEQARLREAIAKLGADQFADREAASKAVLAFGPAAARDLRQVVQDLTADPEVQHRASECLRAMGQVPHAKVAAAAVRVVAAKAPADGAAVLIGFLPAADDRTVADAVRSGLQALAVRNGMPDPAIVAGLTDTVPARRAAAAVALLNVPEVLPKVQAAALAEGDVDTRFQMLFGLATVSRQKAAVAPLVELLPRHQRGRQWQVEDFLQQVAGDNLPAVSFGRYAAGEPGLDTLLKWWIGAAGSLDLAAVKFVPRTSGGLLLVATTASVNGVVVSELGPDLDERWRLNQFTGLADVRPLPDGLLHIGAAERKPGAAGYRVSVVNPATGDQVRTRLFPMRAPNQLDVSYTQAHPLPTGGVLLVGSGEVAEYAADPARKQPVFTFARPDKMDIASACRLADGRTLVIVKRAPPHGLFLDAAGAEIPDKTLAVADPRFYQSVQSVATAADRVLIVEEGRLAEYDVNTGKVVWEKKTSRGAGFSMTHSVQRLPTGNTLYVEVATGGSRVVEVNRDGDEVWTYSPPGSQVNLFRAFQR